MSKLSCFFEELGSFIFGKFVPCGLCMKDMSGFGLN
jgi:hypothetical protein